MLHVWRFFRALTHDLLDDCCDADVGDRIKTALLTYVQWVQLSGHNDGLFGATPRPRRHRAQPCTPFAHLPPISPHPSAEREVVELERKGVLMMTQLKAAFPAYDQGGHFTTTIWHMHDEAPFCLRGRGMFDGKSDDRSECKHPSLPPLPVLRTCAALTACPSAGSAAHKDPQAAFLLSTNRKGDAEQTAKHLARQSGAHRAPAHRAPYRPRHAPLAQRSRSWRRASS
jgi:hypothetical protein